MVVAIGGGKTIDVAKSACASADLPLIVVPTQLTADGIASPVSVIRGADGTLHSGHGRLPIALVVDLDVIAASPPERTRAGLGDLLANRSALVDWRLAAEAGAEEVDDFAALLAQSATDLVYGSAPHRPGGGAPRHRVPAPPAAGTRPERPRDGDRGFVASVLRRGAPDQSRARRAAPGHRPARRAGGVRRPRGDAAPGWGLGGAARVHAVGRHGRARRPASGSAEDELVAVVRAAPSMRPDRYTILSDACRSEGARDRRDSRRPAA